MTRQGRQWNIKEGFCSRCFAFLCLGFFHCSAFLAGQDRTGQGAEEKGWYGKGKANGRVGEGEGNERTRTGRVMERKERGVWKSVKDEMRGRESRNRSRRSVQASR